MNEIEKAYAVVKEQCDHIRGTAERYPESKAAEVVWAFDMALTALREKLETEDALATDPMPPERGLRPGAGSTADRK